LTSEQSGHRRGADAIGRVTRAATPVALTGRPPAGHGPTIVCKAGAGWSSAQHAGCDVDAKPQGRVAALQEM